MELKYELGQRVVTPDYTGCVHARTEYWDGRKLYLVRALVERAGETPPEEWVAESYLSAEESDS